MDTCAHASTHPIPKHSHEKQTTFPPGMHTEKETYNLIIHTIITYKQTFMLFFGLAARLLIGLSGQQTWNIPILT